MGNSPSSIVSVLPLVIDLDGTLIHTDTLHESAIQAFRKNPLIVVELIIWLARGKACLKTRLAEYIDFSAESLPYNSSLILWIREQKQAGRKIILSTAASRKVANRIASHLDLFDEIHATDEIVNNAGTRKADSLAEAYGEKKFDYAGNADVDLMIWKRANAAIAVNTSPALLGKLKQTAQVDKIFPADNAGPAAWFRMLRVHQWLKNLLLFVPLLASHDVFSLGNWTALLIAFIAFGCCASSVYILNDLFDLESDRLHPTKKYRPFASGSIPVVKGVLLAPALFLVSMLLATLVNTGFLLVLLSYFVITSLYSFAIKKLALIDCITLATLYTLRIIAGAVALGHVLSFWMLGFSIFIFLSLAFVKRYAEFIVQKKAGRLDLHGRGYRAEDAPLIELFGVTSGFISVLVLALYLNTETVVRLYKSPYIIWGTIPVLLFWISWIWLQTRRDNMHEDPLIFAVKDRTSLVSGFIFGLILIAGAVGIP